ESFLTEHSLAGIPQPLSYLITDVARRYGTIRVQPAQSVIITADDVGAVELGANRKAAALGLRLIAPTVLTSPLDPVTVVEALRELGLFPVLEGSSIAIDGPPDTDADTPVGDALPADWTGPALSDEPLADEVRDAVAAMLAELPGDVAGRAPAGHGVEPERNTIDRKLQAFWRRHAAVDVVIDGAPRTLTGVVVAIGQTVAILTTTGIVEVPVGALLGVSDPVAG
ncbi:MAG: helicase-associated domain-containing protein, partial [Actinomycetota bacterium]